MEGGMGEAPVGRTSLDVLAHVWGERFPVIKSGLFVSYLLFIGVAGVGAAFEIGALDVTTSVASAAATALATTVAAAG